MKRYNTDLLDEATYLILKGFRYSIKKTGSISSIFSFEETRELLAARKQFFTGNVQVNLHRWLCIRQEIKYAVGKMAVSMKKIKAGNIEIRNGEKYYFIENNKIMSAMFGQTDLHLERLRSGNFFQDMHEASKKIK